jgi:membrane associated rhomboid family serine protease
MNYALIAANVVVFLVMKGQAPTDEAYQALLEGYGYVPREGRVATVFSSMFMHANLLHLLGNMWFLWIFGDNIEARLGALGYLLAYLAVGVAATLAYGAFNAGATLPAVGASGAISGVEGLYFVACPRHRVKVFVWLYVFVTVVHVNARWIMGLWFVLQDLLPEVARQSAAADPDAGGVAHAAHLGGFAAGLVLMLLLRPLVQRIHRAAQAEISRTQRYASGRVRRYDR